MFNNTAFAPRSFNARTVQVLADNDIHVADLDNGMRVIVIPEYDSRKEGVVVRLHIHSGQAMEKKKTTYGLSHLSEHVVPHTEQYPQEPELMARITAFGNRENPFQVGQETTIFTIECLRDELPDALELMAHMAAAKDIAPDVFEEQKAIVVQEMREANKPSYQAAQKLMELIYANFPHNKLVGGQPATVSNITLPELQRYVDEHYRAGNMVLTLSGSIKPDMELLETVREHMHLIPPGSTQWRDERYNPDGGWVLFPYPNAEQLSLRLYFPSVAISDTQNMAALFMLGNMLSAWRDGWMSSKLRGDGLGYDINASIEEDYTRSGLYIGTEVESEYFMDAANIIAEGLEAFLREPDERFLRLFNETKEATVKAMRLDGARFGMSRIAKCLLQNPEFEVTDNLVNLLNRITYEDVRRMALHTFANPLSLVLDGNAYAVDGEAIYNRLNAVREKAMGLISQEPIDTLIPNLIITTSRDDAPRKHVA